MDVTGIVLAGGKSSRMGADKGLLELGGKPIITYAFEALSELCGTVLISSSSSAYNSFGFEVVPDEFPGIGPMGGIYSALRQCKTEKNLVLSCDLPFVSKGLLEFILKNAIGFQVAVPWQGGFHYEPLCAFYNRSVLKTIESYIVKGNYKLPDLFEEVNINRLIINEKREFYQKNLFLNINSKQDLETAQNLVNIR